MHIYFKSNDLVSNIMSVKTRNNLMVIGTCKRMYCVNCNLVYLLCLSTLLKVAVVPFMFMEFEVQIKIRGKSSNSSFYLMQ